MALGPFVYGDTTDPLTIKLAMVMSGNSTVGKEIRAMNRRWRNSTEKQYRIEVDGRVSELDTITLMEEKRAGAAALSVIALNNIDPAFEIFQIPLFFESDEELFHVLKKKREIFQKRLEERGYVMLLWGHIGWTRFFSTKELRSVKDLKECPLLIQDDTGIDFWQMNDFDPRRLVSDRISQGLGKDFDCVLGTPLVAKRNGWHKKHRTNRPLCCVLRSKITPLIGAVMVAQHTWDKIDENSQQLLLEEAKKTQETFRFEFSEKNESSMQALETKGIKPLSLSKKDRAKWDALAKTFAEKKIRTMDQDVRGLLEEIRREREAFRARKSGGTDTTIGDDMIP